MKRGKLRIKGVSDTATVKQEIQDTVRAIVILRDGGCILRNVRPVHGEVLQADHLITRANSATYADTRLIVCVCINCHGWKHWHEREYNALVRTLIGKDRVKLWDKCEQDSWRVVRTGVYDWQLTLVALKQELKKLSTVANK